MSLLFEVNVTCNKAQVNIKASIILVRYWPCVTIISLPCLFVIFFFKKKKKSQTLSYKIFINFQSVILV